MKVTTTTITCDGCGVDLASDPQMLPPLRLEWRRKVIDGFGDGVTSDLCGDCDAAVMAAWRDAVRRRREEITP